ncbi:MAG: FliI/YscN family ATPase [Phycisphaerae bacterium]|nr:FliI/YscN family ATPase [Phycisphaerae bacterium]
MSDQAYNEMLRGVQPIGLSGRVSGAGGLVVTVSDFPVPVGAGCRILRGASHGATGAESPDSAPGPATSVTQPGIPARVIGFAEDQTLVMPLGPLAGICRGDRVLCVSTEQVLPVGTAMLGRVLNGLGEPLDGKGPVAAETRMPLWPGATSPLSRGRISQPLATGVRAIDGLLTVGRGQRMGIFSGSGVGKSVLLGMIARYASSDVNVIALIGERGREVREFLEKDLGPEGLARSVVIVSTSDEPPLVRVQASALACAAAEFFRDRGKDVLLLMDSLTRLAMAQRQIGLVAGEPPAGKGYTPSVFNLLPELLERCGLSAEGSITGFYTVLAEADDLNDPISDAVRSVTDGHIALSRELANRGQYPAIDALQSVSRVMLDVTGGAHQSSARQVRRALALYAEIDELIRIGAYQNGASAEHDAAVAAMPRLREFLSQAIHEHWPLERTEAALCELASLCQPRPTRRVRDVGIPRDTGILPACPEGVSPSVFQPVGKTFRNGQSDAGRMPVSRETSRRQP